VWVVVGGGWWWVCKPNLVFCIGPNQALGLGMGPGSSRTHSDCHVIRYYIAGIDINTWLTPKAGIFLQLWISWLVEKELGSLSARKVPANTCLTVKAGIFLRSWDLWVVEQKEEEQELGENNKESAGQSQYMS
jgi:hypothetical protein